MRELLSNLRKNNIRLKLVEGELSVKYPKGKVDRRLLDEIRLHKTNLINYLTVINEYDYLDIPAIQPHTDYPLSSAQKRLWILSQFEEGSVAYNMPGVYVFEGELNYDALEFAFDTLIARHEILRTVFRENEHGQVRQYVNTVDRSGFKIDFRDLRNEQADVDALIQAVASQPFDLSAGALLRASLFQVDNSKWIFIYVMHHIVSDGWSMDILLKELLVFYNSFLNGASNPLPDLRIQYKDYAAWQQDQLSGVSLDNHKNYWLQQFEGELPVLELPVDKKRPATKTYNGASVSCTIDAEMLNAFKLLAQEQNATLFMAMLGAVNALLYRYTGQQDIITGTQIAGREHADLEDQIGMYLNTLPLRARFAATDNFKQLLENVKQVTLGAYEHQVYPFDELVDSLNLQRDMSRNALFDVSVVLQNQSRVHEYNAQTPITVSSYNGTPDNASKFDLAFDFTETGANLQAVLVYNTDIYTAQTAARLLNHLKQLIGAIINQPSIALNKLDYLTADEKQQLLVSFNDTQVEYPADRSIVALFEQQVQQTPGKIALVFGEKQLTYKELDEQSNKLAHHLRDTLAIQPDDKIGIMLERSDKLLIAILGVLKSGAAYVPVDADYPKARKAFILQDTAVKSLITQTDYIFDLDYYNGDVFAIDVQLDGLATSVEAPALVNQPTDLAYVMYTSGSMGKPKGVMIEHRGVVRLVKSSNYVAFTGDETILSTGAVSFDATTFEYWGALLNGGKLVLCSKETLLDEQRLAEEIREKEADTMWFTAGWLNQLVEKDITVFDGLKTIVAGGDKLSPHHINALRTAYPGVKIINGYGPTENTTFSLTYEITGVVETIPVGKPISNSSAYIVDANNQLCAVGVVGEICVGGDGLARGYLNNPELTAEKFITIPFAKGERIYKTGDLGRWMPDGNIEFIGRKDEQVKIRGFRIELGEIENALLTHPSVDAAVVIVKTTGKEKEIIAYVTGAANDLREYLSKSLPAYMLPSYFVKLDELPLTSNGKVDRKNLPAPEELGLESATTYIAPRNKTEEKLVAIWQDILGKQNISVTANFFEIGGHSLKATRLASQIHKEFEVKIELKELFANLVLEQQAQLIEKAQKTAFSAIKPIAEQEDHALSASQRRLWLLSQFEDANAAYNVPRIYVFDGQLNIQALQKSFNTLIARHESLRTVFKYDDLGEGRQVILSAEQTLFNIAYHDLRNANTQLQQLIDTAFTTPFNLTTGPLLRAAIYQLADSKSVFSYVMHHIISDGWTMDVLIKELLLLYNAQVNGEEDPLTPLRIQYKDYAVWQQEQLSGESLLNHKNYWLQQFEGELPVLELPTDNPRPANKTYAGGHISRSISSTITQGIKTIAQEQDSTLYMALLAAVNTLLHRYTGQEDIIIGTPIANREHIDLDDQIGFYANTLALRTQFSNNDTYAQLLERCKQVTLGAYEHQVYPFDELVNVLQLHRDMSRNPLFDVQVILQNANTRTIAGQSLAGIEVSGYDGNIASSCVFDLVFNFVEYGDGLHLSVEYNSDLFNQETVARMAAHVEQVMNAVIQQPSVAIRNIQYLSDEEKHQLLEAFNNTKVSYPSNKTLVSLFEEQVNQTQDSEAVAFRGVSLTYKELNEQANRFANYLRTEYDVKADEVVGIMLERSEKLIIAILGVLKAGAAYVPIDPAYPTARKQFIINDTAITTLITQTDYIFDLDYFSGNVFAIDVQLDSLETSLQSCDAVIDPAHLAYVIYTSGSTGQPKGVMIQHAAIVNTIYAQQDIFDVKPGERNLQFASVSFDASVSEIFVALASGGSLYIVDEDTKKNPAAFEQYIAENKIDIATIPPAFLSLLNIDNIRALKKLVTAGEAAILDKVSAFVEQGRYFNAYGPTESSICATTYPVAAGSIIPNVNVPIGQPIPNAEVYIIDAHGSLAPVGVAGELCIGGPGLAKGYLNQPELTAQKFVVNAFRNGERMYKTGDLARWLPDGNIEFIGRRDQQVKIRGYRIELGEIENALQKHTSIDAAVVIAKANKSGEKELIAYCVGKDALASTDLRVYLSQSLPAYMIPAHFIQLPEMPVNTSGKIDKKRLPEPDSSGIESGEEYVAPRNETEQKLVLIWQEILGKDRISVKDNFFSLGGHSLKVTRMLSLVHKEFEVKVELKDFFSRIVLEEQAELIEQAKKSSFISIDPIEEQADYLLSSSQRRLWVLSQFAEGNVAYNLPGLFVFEGNLDGDALAWSFNTLIARHEILRTVFREEEGKGVRQIVQSPEETVFEITFQDLRGRNELLNELVQKDFTTAFDLDAAPLIRAGLYQVADDKYYFSYVMHHIVSDGWSMGILMKELMYLYTVRTSNMQDDLTPLRIQYKDYAAWQQQQLSGDSLLNHKEYWLQQFEGELPVLELQGDKPRPAVKTYNGDTINLIIDANLSNALRSFAQEQGGTLFMGLLTAVNLLLHRYTGQQDIITGTQVAGRDHTDLEDQIGMYLNTLALRTKFNTNHSFRQLFENVKQVTLSNFEHQVYPFDELIDALDLHRDFSRNPLFDVSVVLQLEGGQDIRTLGTQDLRIGASNEISNNISKFDLAFDFAEAGEEIRASLVYNTDIYEKATAERLLKHLHQLLAAAIAQPFEAIGLLDYLAENEKQQLLTDFNDTVTAYPKDKTIGDLFAEQAAKTPARTAVVYGDIKLTYKELNDKSTQLANHLRVHHGVKPDDKVGIMLDRSEQLMIAILGVLKSGAAYVPIDPEYPGVRKKFIVEDTAIKVLITQTDYIFDMDYYNGEVFAIDVQMDGLDASLHLPRYINRANDLAYIMYTSGSTGKPKGVMVEHRSVIRLVKSSEYVAFTGNEVLLSTGAISFDAVTFEYWGTLLNGGKLVLCSKETLLDEQLLAAEIRMRKVDMMWFTAGWLNQLVEKDVNVFRGLRTIVAGGDKLSVHHINTLKKTYPEIRIINGYGPTENTTFSLTYEITGVVETIPVGKPVSNSNAYILDGNNQLCAVGVVGEICVGGDGLARGYLNNPELTAEKFITIPFAKGERIYRTGDLGRWMADGNIEFIGRKDEQVKIRGFRIEMGEIENTLLTHAGIDAAVVVARANKDGEKEIVAYVTGDASDLREYLAERLPSYMIPLYFVKLDSFPLTLNGKVDRKNLPNPRELELETGSQHIAPRNKTEERLAAIWQDILGKQNISVTDNFFEIGGHSLKATRLASQIHKEFNVKIELKDLFMHLVLEQQAMLIEQAKRSSFVSIVPVAEQDDYAVSSSQRRLWVLSQFGEANNAYNIPGAYVFEGELDREALTFAFNELIARHEILRTVFSEDSEGKTRQNIRTPEETGFEISFNDLRGLDNQQSRLEELVQSAFTEPFDLVHGPLLRAGLFQLANDKWVLSYVLHHIISDGWSMNILIKELLSVYNAKVSGHAYPLAPLRIQYKDYAAWQQQQLSGDALNEHKAYWLNQFEGELPVLELPADRARPIVKTYRGAVVSKTIPSAISTGINELSRQQGGTMFMGIMAAVNALLYRYTGQQDIIIGSPIAGRQHADLEDQIGFYVNTLALRARFNDTDSYTQLLQHIKQVTLNAYQHQVYPFDELVDALQLKRDVSRNPLFDVSVVLQNAGNAVEGQQFGSLSTNGYEGGESTISKFDLLFGFVETANGLQLSLEYNTDIFNKETVIRLTNHLEQLMTAIVAQPATAIAHLNYLGDEEKQHLLSMHASSAAAYPHDATIVSLFEEQVARTPDNTAVVFEGKTLTYTELNEKSNRLADYLRSNYNIQAEDLVGMKLERSLEMIIAIMAILKSGGAYVPIDPAYPQERIDYMIEDSRCKVVIDDEELAKFNAEESNYSSSNLIHVNKPGDLAYVIYTSGTTGKPKGSLIEHRNVVRLFKTDKPLFDFTENDVWTMFHSYCFDFSVWEMYGALLFGGRVVVIPLLTAKDPAAYLEVLNREGVTVLNQTPSAFYNLIKEELEKQDATLKLRYVIFGGEALSPGKLVGFNKKYPSTELINMYGITETTVHVTYKKITSVEIENNSSNIGKPIPTLTCYVLDQYQQLCATGVPGELYVGGDGVCRGYLNREELTAKKFIENPFVEGERLYRSGDKATLLANGELEYGGRIDEQVKIRGFRIELGEIEAALQTAGGVESAVVVARENSDGEKELIAYVVGVVEQTAVLRSHLGKTLPAYMIPAYFVQLDKIPLTSNGKIDKKNLPAPESSAMATGPEYVAPATETESILVSIYEDVLKRKPIGIREDFFALGGDSIKSIQIVSRIKQKGYSLAIQDILLYPAIEDLAKQVRSIARNADQSIIEGIVPLSPVQHYLFASENNNPEHFNQSVLLTSRERMSEDALRAALDKIVLHHDALRMAYTYTPEGWVQENKGSAQSYSFEVIEGADEAGFKAQCDRIQASMNLENGPLFKVALFRNPLQSDRLLLVAHHLVIDGVSWRILFEDLSALYQQAVSGAAISLPLKTDSFRYWQHKQVEYASSAALRKEDKYWSAIEAASIPSLPVDKANGSNQVQDGATASFILNKDLTGRLLTQCHKAYHTDTNDILLTALGLALTDVFGIDKVLVKLEGHGRENIGADVDVTRTIGWFTTLYPVLLDMQYNPDITRQLIEVKESLHRVPNKGIGYGVLRYLSGKKYKLEPEITFNYLGDFGSGVNTATGEQLFEYSGDYRGQEMPGHRHRDAKLDVSGMVTDGSLRIAVTYSSQQYTASTIERITAAYKRQLQQLIETLSAEEDVHMSPVDFTYKGLSVEQLQKLNQIL
jgi:tyrocidine synthetase III